MTLPKQTLGERGFLMPVGIVGSDTRLNKGFAFRPWRMKEERALGALRDQNRMNVAQFVSIVLGTMLTRLGPHDFESMTLEQRRVHVGQMFLPDVYYTYMRLRLEALGPELKVQMPCPRCGKDFSMGADLSTTEVSYLDDLTDFSVDYTLKRPFVVRGQEVCRILFGLPRWNALESVQGGSMNTGEAKSALILGSIKAIEGMDALLAPHELDDLSKLDLETILRLLDDGQPGPVMSLEAVCPHCQSKFDQSLDWGYDSFFGVSNP